MINRAIGVLIDQGHHPDQAHDELLRRADNDKTRLPKAARCLLAATAGTHPPAEQETAGH